MKFFFDNCISRRIARALDELVQPDHHVEHLTARFPTSTPDIKWIPTIADEGGWILVSGDLRIKTRPLERELWRSARITTFFMAEGFVQVPAWEQVRWMIDKWPLIVEQAARVTPGAAFLVPKRGQKLTAI